MLENNDWLLLGLVIFAVVFASISPSTPIYMKDRVVVAIFSFINQLFKRVLVQLAYLEQRAILVYFFHILQVLVVYYFGD